MTIPHFALTPAADEIRTDLLARWSDLLARTAFVGGAEVQAFERDFASFVGAPECVGVANGTDALVLALRALGVRPGDHVLVAALTFFDAADAAARATAQTVGVIGVHLYGQPFDVDAVGELCAARGWFLIEDAAQAHGATWKGRRVGSTGALAGWSFYPSKNLGCFGDGGAVTGSDRAALAQARLLSNHGRVQHYEHGAVGTNSRLDALQAAVLNLRLPLLERDNARRRALVAKYRERLAGVGDLRFLDVAAGAEPVYHQLIVRSAVRDRLRDALQERQ